MQEKEKDGGILNNGKMEKEKFWGDENWEREWWRRIKSLKEKEAKPKFVEKSGFFVKFVGIT